MNNKKFVEKLEKYLKRQFGVTISNASKRQVYEALMSTVRDDLSEKKFSYEQELKKTKQKRLLSCWLFALYRVLYLQKVRKLLLLRPKRPWKLKIGSWL